MMEPADETSPLLHVAEGNHTQPATRLLLLLDGLTSEQVLERRALHGPNELPSNAVPLWRRIVKHAFLSPIAVLIWLAAVVAGLVQDWIDMGLVIALQLGNTTLAFVEEGKARAALDALQSQVAPHACVLRDGAWSTQPAASLVPGDVIRFGIGDAIPADAVLASPCQVDESALTGESLPANRKRGDAVFSGSFCTKGSTSAVVTATGVETKFGRSAALMSSVQSKGHYEAILRRIATLMLSCTGVVIAIIIVMQFASGRRAGLAGVEDVAALSLVLVIAALPVALAAVSTTTMALAARQLAHNEGVICTKLSAIQELATLTTLCLDKTGTLTLNQLHLTEPWVNAAHTKEELLLWAALASDYTSPHRDAIDSCIVAALEPQALDAWEQVNFTPFEPALKRCEATVRQRAGTEDARTVRIAKGSPQTLLELGAFDGATKRAVTLAVDSLAQRGFRSIGVMLFSPDRFVGIVSLHDPPRPDAVPVMTALTSLGVRTAMVSGDHRAIVRETCTALHMAPVVLHGVDSDDVQQCNAFAEVYPEDKFAIVESLQQRSSSNNTVAMTGDGLNDAAALRRADIGIAVDGASDMARAASDLALSRPGLAPIVAAVVCARATFERLRNYISFRVAISTNVLLSTLLLLALYDFQLPPLAIVIHIVLMDVTVIMSSKDHVQASLVPCQWRLMELFAVAGTVGLLSVVEVCSVYWLASQSALFYSAALSRDELRALVYLTLSIGSQLCIFVVRTRSLFFSRRPGLGLALAVAGSACIATCVAIFASSSVLTGVKGVVATDALCTLCVLAVGFLIKDLCKYAMLMAFDRMRTDKERQHQLDTIMEKM